MHNCAYPSSQHGMSLDISVITDARKNFPMLLDCLRSFQKHHCNWRNYSLNVTIAYSRKGYAEEVRKIWSGARITETSGMKSYSENHNNNMKKMEGTYILLLNDDVLFVENVIDAVLAYMEENKEILALSPRLVNPDGSIQPSINAKRTLMSSIFMYTGLRRFVRKDHWTWSLMSHLSKRAGGSSPYIAHDSVKDVWSFAGACEFIRREGLSYIGLMDEVTQFWGEEAEWHHRMIRAGGRVVYFPQVQVVHIGGQTTNFKGAHYKLIKRQFNESFEINRAKAYLSYFSKWHYGFQYRCLRSVIFAGTAGRLVYAVLCLDSVRVETFLKILRLVLHPEIFLKNSLRYFLPATISKRK